MTAPHDTPEAVEADIARLKRRGCTYSAAMLRRLHQRAVDAERERDAANEAIAYQADQLDSCTHAYKEARADALREAAATRMQCNTAFEMYCAILALINQPNSTGET